MIPVLSLIRACVYRLACRPGTVVVLGFFVIVSVALPFLFVDYWSDCVFFSDAVQRAGLAPIVGCSAAVWLSVCFTGDFKYGTVRSLMVGPRSRIAYGLALLATGFLCTAVLALLCIVAFGLGYFAAGGAPLVFDGVKLAAQGLLLISVAVGYFLIVQLVAALAGSTVGIVTCCFLVPGILYWFANAAVTLLPAIFQPAASDLLSLTLFARIGGLASGLPLELWQFADTLAVIVLASALFAFFMSRKELK